MSKVRINDLARELEVKPRAIIDVLPEIGVAGVKTHSSSLEADEAEKVRARFEQDAKHTTHGAASSSRQPQGIVPKITFRTFPSLAM
jgi:translation initiation factor IF-2